MTWPIQVNPQDYANIGMGLPPQPVPPAPVHDQGATPVDMTALAFGAATNADLAMTNSQIAADHVDRTGHAADAVRKFSEHEADAAAQFEQLAGKGDAALAGKGPQDAMGGAMQGITGALQGVTGALSGVLGSVGKVPQGLMQAGQGALSPLMSLAKGGLGGATLASNVHPDLGSAGISGSGGSGGGLGMGTTPASNLGPPPVPGTVTPTTPASAMGTAGAAGSPGGAPGPGGGGGGMMPMMPGGAGGGKGGKDGATESKRIAAPGMPNGQPVKGRTTASPSVPVTKSATKDVSHPGITPLKRIVDKKDSSK